MGSEMCIRDSSYLDPESIHTPTVHVSPAPGSVATRRPLSRTVTWVYGYTKRRHQFSLRNQGGIVRQERSRQKDRESNTQWARYISQTRSLLVGLTTCVSLPLDIAARIPSFSLASPTELCSEIALRLFPFRLLHGSVHTMGGESR